MDSDAIHMLSSEVQRLHEALRAAQEERQGWRRACLRAEDAVRDALAFIEGANSWAPMADEPARQAMSQMESMATKLRNVLAYAPPGPSEADEAAQQAAVRRRDLLEASQRIDKVLAVTDPILKASLHNALFFAGLTVKGWASK